MSLITDSEMEDFDAAILGAGFEVDDFNIVDLENDPTAKEQHPITGTVTVHRISTDEAITYSAGHLSTWVTELEKAYYEQLESQPKAA